MTEITSSVDIPASPSTVWDVLTDVDAYSAWNTLLRVSGDYVVGETVDARLSVPGLPTVSFAPTIVTVDPDREITWRSTLFGHAAEHTFRIEPAPDGTTTFVQHETIDGPLAAPVVGRLDRRLERGFEQMNVGLRRRAIELDGH